MQFSSLFPRILILDDIIGKLEQKIVANIIANTTNILIAAHFEASSLLLNGKCLIRIVSCCYTLTYFC